MCCICVSAYIYIWLSSPAASACSHHQLWASQISQSRDSDWWRDSVRDKVLSRSEAKTIKYINIYNSYRAGKADNPSMLLKDTIRLLCSRVVMNEDEKYSRYFLRWPNRWWFLYIFSAQKPKERVSTQPQKSEFKVL